MTVIRETTIFRYVCASGDTKPTTGVPAGSIAYEHDTCDTYIYNGSSWVKKPDINEAVTDLGTIDVDTGNIDTSLNNIETDTGNMSTYLGTIDADTGNIDTSLNNIEKAFTYTADRTTGSAAISKTVTPGAAFRLEEVRVHLSAAGGASENLTVTLDGGAAASVYDTVLLTQNMSAVSNICWKPTRPIICAHASDAIAVAYTNTNGRTYGLTVIYTLI